MWIKIEINEIKQRIAFRLETLELELEEGDITKKGYCSKQWQILKPHVDQKYVNQVEGLQARLVVTGLPEVDLHLFKLIFIDLLNIDKETNFSSLLFL